MTTTMLDARVYVDRDGQLRGWLEHTEWRDGVVTTRRVPIAPAQAAPERIAAAAIRVGGVVWTLPPPARHCHLLRAWSEAHWTDGEPARIGEHEQGFVTTAGRFVEREDAARIAHAAGQLAKIISPLCSEDLW